jgi:hypothetical protein
MEMEEKELDITPPYPDITAVKVAIEDITDTAFVQKWVDSSLWGTPLYFKDALERWPERHAKAITTMAQAQPGGVLFHCIRGHDRTGIIALLLLSIAGVMPEEIIADYELSKDPIRDKLLLREGVSVREAMLGVLGWLEVDRYLLAGGTSRDDLVEIRRRLAG